MGKKIFEVYLAKEDVPNNEAYAKLDLPASPWELWDAILTDGPMSVISRQAICFLLRGAVWTLNCVASRSVASASFSLLTLPGRSRPSFYLMYLTKRKTVRRRSHRCTDSI